MSNRIFSNWNNRRTWYVALGSIVTVHSVIVGEWPGILFGAYFAAMGIFSFGCAAGNCRVPGTTRARNARMVDAEYEEVK